jgi:hypothetical protein
MGHNALEESMAMARDEAEGVKTRDSRSGLAGSIRARIEAVLRNGFAGLGRVRSERRMELIETLQLGGKRQLLLVMCDGQRYLVGAGGDSVHSIAEIVHGQPRSVFPEAEGKSVVFRPPIASVVAHQEMRCY